MSNVEIETKIKLSEIEAISLKGVLQQNHLDTYSQEDLYYTNLPAGVSIRIRKERNEGFITLKTGFKTENGLNIRKEFEPSIKVTEIVVWKKMLAALGFQEDTEVKKARSEYSSEQDGIKIFIDCVNGLGFFCEVECIAESVDEAGAKIKLVLEDLELHNKNHEARSYKDLVKDSIKEIK